MSRTKAKKLQEPTTSAPNQRSNTLKLKIDHLITVDPLTNNQKKFFDLYRKGHTFLGAIGSAGTGKSFISIYKALEQVLDPSNCFEKMIVIRSSVFVRDSGFLPGTIEEKTEIFEDPYVDICSNLFRRSDAWQRLKEQHVAKFLPTTALRGISFDNSIVVVDECQSMSFHELNTIITRCGKNTKIIFVGDTKQNDLIKSKHDSSGLKDFLRVAETMREFQGVTFTSDDIVRGPLVKSWIMSCERMGI